MSSRTRGWVWNLDSLDITFFFSSRRRHTRFDCDWSSDVCSSDLGGVLITEKPIYAYTATEFPPKSLPVTQFEMHAAEDFGLRSEERRVGKECRPRWSTYHEEEKDFDSQHNSIKPEISRAKAVVER